VKSAVLDRIYEHYQRIDRCPPRFVESLPPLGESERRERLEDRVRALRLPVDPLAGQPMPSIEVLLVAAPKDFALLGSVTRHSIANAGNPVSHVTFIVPEAATDQASKIAEALNSSVTVEVVSEDDVIDSHTRDLVLATFGERYGWILQQLLAVAHVSTASSAGVLVLDADTLLLRPRVLLTGTRQVLMESLEHHYPYFEFIESLDSRFAGARASHVTHHMLQQPDVTRSILAEFCGGEVGALARLVCERTARTTVSAVCVDYELYAQGLIALFPERAIRAKWSNATVGRRAATDTSLRALAKRYCSVSLHHYVT
jgi:hypothetical protein